MKSSISLLAKSSKTCYNKKPEEYKNLDEGKDIQGYFERGRKRKVKKHEIYTCNF